MPQIAWLGLGGNIGDPVRAMAMALQALDGRSDCEVVAVSRLYRTPPWGKTDQDWFYNACASVRMTLGPEALLDVCLDIERDMKRVRNERWGPRTIDIDVLAVGEVRWQTEKLTVPHPRMTSRGFVMVPLNDIAPDGKIEGRMVAEWMKDCDRTGIEQASTDDGWWRNG